MMLYILVTIQEIIFVSGMDGCLHFYNAVEQIEVCNINRGGCGDSYSKINFLVKGG